MNVRCPYCHILIPQESYGSHEQQHTRLKPDGQKTDHVTGAPEQRYAGSLEGVPRVYRHARCGGGTGMPEEIIRSYLVNPLLYIDRTFCCRCGDYVNPAELKWVETGENLMDYWGSLRAAYLERAYGISQADQRKQGVVVTPVGAEAISHIARRRGWAAPYFLALKLAAGKTKTDYVCAVVGAWNPETETAVPSAGVRIIVPRDQLEQLRGTIVHYATPPMQGFLLSRLYAPKKGT